MFIEPVSYTIVIIRVSGFKFFPFLLQEGAYLLRSYIALFDSVIEINDIWIGVSKYSFFCGNIESYNT